MINTQRAFLQFWSQFKHPTTGQNLQVFLDNYAVIPNAQGRPETPIPPYITFNFSRDDFLTNNIVTGRVWTRQLSNFTQVTNILDQIDKAVPVTGIILNLENNEGAIKLDRSTPFIQYQPVDDQQWIVGHVSLVARSYVI